MRSLLAAWEISIFPQKQLDGGFHISISGWGFNLTRWRIFMTSSNDQFTGQARVPSGQSFGFFSHLQNGNNPSIFDILGQTLLVEGKL
tara:strand:- start:389 stop:652 length:264 start_codon:yes stop_codon:yes gene_type:complete